MPRSWRRCLRERGPATNLFDMEATWFELEAACHTRRNKFGRALKYYHAVLTHFNQFVEDQFDFHAYCLRRTSINAYMDLLKVEDSMYAETVRAAAKGAVMLYVNLFDEPRPRSGCFRSQDRRDVRGRGAKV